MSTFTLRAKRRRSALRTVAFLSPWLIGFGVFFAYPLVSTVYFSLMKYDGFGTPVFRGLGNWSYVFNDYPMFWPALRNTLWLVLVMVTCRVVFGLGVGLLITKIKTGTGVFRTLFYLPYLAPPVAALLRALKRLLIVLERPLRLAQIDIDIAQIAKRLALALAVANLAHDRKRLLVVLDRASRLAQIGIR